MHTSPFQRIRLLQPDEVNPGGLFSIIDNDMRFGSPKNVGHEFKIPVFIPRPLEALLGVKFDSITTDKDVLVSSY